jgi:hypothetical protein
MKNKTGIIFCIIGILCIINTIFGRYIVLPGYFETLNAGGGIPEGVPVIKIIRYLLWAFSFKLGIYFFVIGVLLKHNKSGKEILIFSGAGFVYIASAYIPIPLKSSLFFGIGGSLVTIVSLVLFWTMAATKQGGNRRHTVFDYLGLFLIVMGIYNLCPLMGVKCFALYPEKMIRYNLQDDAFSFANHIMIEFALGFILLLYSKIKPIK